MPIERLIDRTGFAGPPDDLYSDPRFPAAPRDRPYLYINMVSTADGKTLVGQRGSSAKGVGEPTDQTLMRRLEETADAIIVGAGTLRASNIVYPAHVWRIAVSGSGALPFENRFFTDAPDRVIVAVPASTPRARRDALEGRARVVVAGGDDVDPVETVGWLRRDFGIERLLLEGGASTNFAFLVAGVVDELFLSLTPKLKGGAHLPTVVDGPGLPGREYLPLELLSLYRDGDELYLRYRVGERKTA